MARIVLNFAEARTAEFPVAGLPAAARALREVAIAARDGCDIADCTIVAGAGWVPDARCRDELARLGGALSVAIAATAPPHEPGMLHIAAERLVPAATIAGALPPSAAMPDGIFASTSELDSARCAEAVSDRLARLRTAARAIVKATGKVGDGPVSRWLNRPVSQAISRALLHIPGMTPMIATGGTVILAIAMALCLLFGESSGVVWGALLFHAASVFDGVDGEIARATFRSSAAGARLDSLTDAATNIAFITGLSFNIIQQGRVIEGAIGFVAVALLGLGLFLLGQRAKARGAHYGFNAVKDRFNAKGSRALTFVAQIAARDFFAFAFAVSAVVGMAIPALMIFAFGAIVWFIVITITLIRTRSDIGR